MFLNYFEFQTARLDFDPLPLRLLEYSKFKILINCTELNALILINLDENR